MISVNIIDNNTEKVLEKAKLELSILLQRMDFLILYSIEMKIKYLD